MTTDKSIKAKGYTKDGECIQCDRVGEALIVDCQIGAFPPDSALCPKCMVKTMKVRAGGAKKSTPPGEGVIRITP
ncbi:MAG TPA: hypothetical protein VD866_01270 [Urbifossiella sp.]|nr:hypothetical protein [Urbifossiella sp.]